ncbi:protein OPI10 homolog [Macrosteles quadrilineatus]|uniref:protein OPI10 homolog n=1 Tax=Macrosteles quadrilineatus TaxID=74068 RepID=UPI0023E303A2|nr:protein OPI10 homolog [Macrosteles quadrilineatus]XP_054280541.1 protein OPI10 homolog [Macrosteles quadrilineatus]
MAATTNMFGVLVIGRMVETNFQQVAERQFVTVIPNADDTDHLAVFLTGQICFPAGAAGLIYFSCPDPNAPPNWQLLGYISNDKPSSVFKITGLKNNVIEQSGFLQFAQQAISHNAQIGISVEPIEVVQQQIIQLENSKPNEASNFLEFTKKMLENFSECVSSFLVPGSPFVVPLSVVDNWYKNFEKRLEMNPRFWK